MCPFFHSKTGLSISLRVFNPEKFFYTFSKATESEKMNTCVERCLRGKIFFVFSGMWGLGEGVEAQLPQLAKQGPTQVEDQEGGGQEVRSLWSLPALRVWVPGSTTSTSSTSEPKASCLDCQASSTRRCPMPGTTSWGRGWLTTSEPSPQRRIWRYQQSSTQTCMRWGSLML